MMMSDYHQQKQNNNNNNNNNNTDSSSSSLLIPEGRLPSYLATAFGDLYENDGLAVFGKGLGWLTLMASFVRFYADIEEGHIAIVQEEAEEEQEEQKQHQKQEQKLEQQRPPLVLVLGLNDQEHDSLLQMLSSWGTPHEMMPTVITNESGQASARQEMYSRGGVFCITSRILIVDLLTKTLSSKDVDGILVGHADQVTHDSTEAFIIRIYTSQKRRDQCFIKAFTDAPDALLSGFAKVEKTLKALQVRNLYLYPRFHDSIKRELEQNPPQVEELHQKLSPSMMDIQAAMVVAVQSCMKELKQSTPFVEWNHTSSDLNIENCVTTAFDRAISRQLEKDWHRLQPKTKQLVQDLRTLRTLLEALIQYDCVSFWKLLQSIKTMSAASRHPAMWLLTPAADMIFKKAKERIYKIQTKEPTPKVPKPVVKLLPVLEENPKWRLLKTVLLEIKQQTEQQKERQLQEEEEFQATILVVVKDDRTVDIVRSYLVEGRDRTMTLRWLRYLEQYNDRSRSVADCKISEESRLLLEEESRVRRILFGNLRHENNEVNKNHDMKKRHVTAASLNTVPAHVRKRRRIATEKGRGADVGATAEDRERQAVLEDAIEAAEHDMMETASRTGNPDTGMDVATDEQEYDDEEDEMFHTMFQVTMPQEPNIVIKSLASMDGTTAGMFLADLHPDYVVLYDYDVGFVRSLEVHAALTVNEVNAKSKKSAALKVYFLMFEASAEQKVFLKALQREKNAFERLIHHKKTMPPPVLRVEGTQEMQQALARGDGVAGTYQGGSLPLSMDTRTGGGQAKDVARNIAVDVREFRSALPSILHQGGMRLAPVTLTVGDFVLSNVHCVERKSISDLFGSFASGRLYSQAEQMSKYYTCPCLLIEFDPQKTFCLQNAHELGMDIKTDSICSKLAILTMHFPKLSVLWSKSPHETLRLFKELKASHGEVDVAKAVEIGRNDSVEALLSSENGGGDGDDDDDDDINEAGRDMLLSLPGMTVQIARRVMEKCDCLADLMVLSRDELRSLVGPVAGQKLFTFFHQQLGSL